MVYDYWNIYCEVEIMSILIITVLPAAYFLFLKRCDAQMDRTPRYPIMLLTLLIILELIILILVILAVENVWKISSSVYLNKLISISFGILLSLTVLFLGFKLIPTSTDTIITDTLKTYTCNHVYLVETTNTFLYSRA